MESKKPAQHRQRPKYTKAQQRRDTMQAYGVLFGIGVALIGLIVYFVFIRNTGTNNEQTADAPQTVTMQKIIGEQEVSNTDSKETASEKPAAETEPKVTTVTEAPPAETVTTTTVPAKPAEAEGHKLEVKDGITYVDGIMIVNKTYSLPASYAPGLDPTAEAAFNQMASDAWADGISLFICSGFRTYREQEMLYNSYASTRGTEEADRVSSRAGHSEHQSGLCMDINTTDFSFAGSKEAVWLSNHCADYGFIIRFPLGKESVTGYTYEPWHIRYVGLKAAKEIFEQDICLEEYLGVTSDYKNSSDQNGQT